MKIGIYGDSFATYYQNGWPEIIQEKFNATIDMFSMGNSSIEWSYNNFLATHESYDMIIFVMSHWHRTSLIDRKDDTHLLHHETSVRLNHSLSQNIDYHKRKTNQKFNELNPVKEHYNLFPPLTKAHIKYQKYTLELLQEFPNMLHLYHDAIRNSVKYIRPDAHVIEGFGNHANNYAGMVNITNDEIEKLQPKGSMQEDNFDIRINHMTFTQNREFANYLYKHINSKTFDIHNTLQRYKTSKYYTLSETLEESGLVYK